MTPDLPGASHGMEPIFALRYITPDTPLPSRENLCRFVGTEKNYSAGSSPSVSEGSGAGGTTASIRRFFAFTRVARFPIRSRR